MGTFLYEIRGVQNEVTKAHILHSEHSGDNSEGPLRYKVIAESPNSTHPSAHTIANSNTLNNSATNKYPKLIFTI